MQNIFKIKNFPPSRELPLAENCLAAGGSSGWVAATSLDQSNGGGGGGMSTPEPDCVRSRPRHSVTPSYTNDTSDHSELISNFILTLHHSPDNFAEITHALLTELWPVCQTGNSGETDAKTREFLKRVVEILLDHITIQNDRTVKILDFHSVGWSFFYHPGEQRQSIIDH